MAKEQAGTGKTGLDHMIQPLHEECEAAQSLFHCQPAPIQRFLEAQGHRLAEAILQNQPQICFNLPDRVITNARDPAVPAGTVGTTPVPVPAESREQKIGGVIARLTHAELCQILKRRLAELEASPHKSVVVSAQLVCFATAHFLVYRMLPSVRFVPYPVLEGTEIRIAPIVNSRHMQYTISGQTKVIAVTGASYPGYGALPVPFTPEALHFIQPQWVTLNEQRDRLANPTSAAEKLLALLQKYLVTLHTAVALTPYFVFDGAYKLKHFCTLSQLVNQGRALARFQMEEIIQGIKQRAEAEELNRGLGLSLPFFDDEALEIRQYDFTVIPAGRIIFVPAFVVRASRKEQDKVAQDTHLSPTTRKYLLQQLKMLENAFLSCVLLKSNV